MTNLRLLKTVAEEILQTVIKEHLAARSDSRTTEAGGWNVNWGDLHCVEASATVTDTDEKPHLSVLIEEADPSNMRLHVVIEGLLKEAGWPDVEVRTEW